MARSGLDRIDISPQPAKKIARVGGLQHPFVKTDINTINVEHHFIDTLQKTSPNMDCRGMTAGIFIRLSHMYKILTTLESPNDVTYTTPGSTNALFFKTSTQPQEPRPEELASKLTQDDIKRILLTIESETRGQGDNAIWTLLRRNLITASTLKWSVSGPVIPPQWFYHHNTTDTYGDAAAMAFGKTNEPAARAIVEALFIDPADIRTPDHLTPEATTKFFNFDMLNTKSPSLLVGTPRIGTYECGLLIDVRTGLIGASLDVLVCDRDPLTGTLNPHPAETDISFFEIKCRAKYLFDPDDKNNPLGRTYTTLINRPTMANLRDFLYTIKNPCVSFFGPSANPSTREALITDHVEWKRLGFKGGRALTELDAHHLGLNRTISSRVWVFNDPDIQKGTITTIAWATGDTALQIPVFANPRHANFKQIAVQTYVLSGYFPALKLRPFLVTFIGRGRRPHEVGVPLRVDTQAAAIYEYNWPTIPPHCAVPVIAVLTPIEVDVPRVTQILKDTGNNAITSALRSLRWDNLHPAVEEESVDCANGTTSLLRATEKPLL
uniref:ORF48 n=1 Tax=Human herpesvirus 3 TaxID=10335 RepID=A0A0F7GKV3_HHV3|nr:ORF48 [Human alphaherpesvirus 3]